MIRLTVKIDPRMLAGATAAWSPDDASRLATDWDRVLAHKNFPQVLMDGQGSWKPLSPRYLARKVRMGKGSSIWSYDNRTARALTRATTVRGVSGSGWYGKRVDVVLAAPHGVAVEWSVKTGASGLAAGGYFAKVNATRPLMVVLPSMFQPLARAAQNMVLSWMRRAGFKVTGRDVKVVQ